MRLLSLSSLALLLILASCSGNSGSGPASSAQESTVPPSPSEASGKNEETISEAHGTITFSQDVVVKNYRSLNELAKELPVFGEGLHVISSNNSDIVVDYKTDRDIHIRPVAFPVHFYDAMTDSVRFADAGFVGGMSSFADQRASYPFAGIDEITIHAYFRIDLGNAFTNLFCSLNEIRKGEIASRSYRIYAFDRKGSLISEMGKLNDFYVLDKGIWSVWYYASDRTPHYERTVQRKDGIFDEISSSRKKPAVLENLAKN